VRGSFVGNGAPTQQSLLFEILEQYLDFRKMNAFANNGFNQASRHYVHCLDELSPSGMARTGNNLLVKKETKRVKCDAATSSAHDNGPAAGREAVDCRLKCFAVADEIDGCLNTSVAG
jgi:hypothetical protein